MSNHEEVVLCPSQQRAFNWINRHHRKSPILQLGGQSGGGRSTVLRKVHRELGGAFLTIADFVEASRGLNPLALEEAIAQPLLAALRQHDVVIADDLHVATAVMSGCRFYPRSGWLDAPLSVVAAYAEAAGKTLILGTPRYSLPDAFEELALSIPFAALGTEDYQHLCRYRLGERAAAIDFDQIYRFAPHLNGHQLRNTCAWFQDHPQIDTEQFLNYLRTHELTSNVELGEVADVELTSLRGVDEVIRSLEANIVLPLENDALIKRLDLKPKRGVLLVGPPGTGKTTVGRALAHRLKGKFFLIDGTMISGTDSFYHRIDSVFRAATENAPAVIFVDDSDVIFESGREHGLYRYLLTMLDGLESKSVGRVCVMMTAMDVGNLPPALVRSGRIELWLEMRPPDLAARRAIVSDLVARLPDEFRDLRLDEIASATSGFTGADLKRTVEDAKILYANDLASQTKALPLTDYFLKAVAETRQNKDHYAAAEARANAVRSVRPPWFTRVPHNDEQFATS